MSKNELHIFIIMIAIFSSFIARYLVEEIKQKNLELEAWQEESEGWRINYLNCEADLLTKTERN